MGEALAGVDVVGVKEEMEAELWPEVVVAVPAQTALGRLYAQEVVDAGVWEETGRKDAVDERLPAAVPDAAHVEVSHVTQMLGRI